MLDYKPKIAHNLPNIFTSLRITASVLLLFFSPATAAFIALYIFCGITDMADGFLARKLNAQTRFGSAFDSAADLVFALCAAVKLIPLAGLRIWLIIWLCLIITVRAAAIVICLIKYRHITILHTVTNKVAGFVTFLMLPTFCLLSWQWCAAAGCIAASVAAVDELLHMSLSKEMPLKEREFL